MKNTKMKNTKLSFEGMSHNLQYVFTNRGVVKLSEQLNDLNGKNYLSYTYNNLNVAIDIMKENFDFKCVFFEIYLKICILLAICI